MNVFHPARALSLALALAPLAARADGPPSAGDAVGDLEALLGESVVTTASLNAERASVAPSTVFNITAAELRASGVRTVSEAVEQLGLGVYVASPRDYLTGVDVGAQGLLLRDGGRHVLVMLNGLTLNSQGTGRVPVNEALGVPLESIDHIEVMLGPGSVMYGSNAMLAVINVVTLRARDLHGVHASADVGTSPAQDANGGFTTGSGTRPGLRYHAALGGGSKFTLGGSDGEVTWTADFTQELSSSYAITPFTGGAAGNQSLLPGETAWGGNATHQLRAPSAVVEARLGGFRLLVNAFDYYRNMPLVGTFSNPQARERQTGLRVDLSHALDIGDRFQLATRLYAGYGAFAERSVYGESFWCVAGQDNGCVEETRATSWWAGLDSRLTADWASDGRFVTTLGGDARPVWMHSDPADYTDLVTGAVPDSIALPHNEESSFLGAVFAQQVVRPVPWLALNAGARMDFQSGFGARLSPRAAAVVTLGKGTTLRLSYSEAFRAPSLFERSEFDPTYRITPAGLRPETVRSTELEARQQLSRLTLSLRGYRSTYQDFIESRAALQSEVEAFASRISPTADPTIFVVNDNLQGFGVWGASLAPSLRLPFGFTISGTLNLSRAERDDGTLERRLPRWYGNWRVSWQSAPEGVTVAWTGLFAGKRPVSLNEVATPYDIGARLDQRLSASGGFGAVRGLRWQATVGFDANAEQPYAIALGANTPAGYVLYPDQPRLFVNAGLRYTFGSQP